MTPDALAAFMDHARTVDPADAAHELAHYVSVVEAATYVLNAAPARLAGAAS